MNTQQGITIFSGGVEILSINSRKGILTLALGPFDREKVMDFLNKTLILLGFGEIQISKSYSYEKPDYLVKLPDGCETFFSDGMEIDLEDLSQRFIERVTNDGANPSYRKAWNNKERMDNHPCVIHKVSNSAGPE